MTDTTRFSLVFDVPQKITLEDLSESKSALEEKSADRSHSVNSMQTATHETTNVAVYEVGNTEKSLCTCTQYIKKVSI